MCMYVCISTHIYLHIISIIRIYIHMHTFARFFSLFLFCIHTYVYVYHKCTEIFKALLIYITFNILQVVLSSVEWTRHSDETQNRIIFTHFTKSDIIIPDTHIYTANGQAMQALLKWERCILFSFCLYSSNVVIM